MVADLDLVEVDFGNIDHRVHINENLLPDYFMVPKEVYLDNLEAMKMMEIDSSAIEKEQDSPDLFAS